MLKIAFLNIEKHIGLKYTFSSRAHVVLWTEWKTWL